MRKVCHIVECNYMYEGKDQGVGQYRTKGQRESTREICNRKSSTRFIMDITVVCMTTHIIVAVGGDYQVCCGFVV